MEPERRVQYADGFRAMPLDESKSLGPSLAAQYEVVSVL